MVVRHTYRPRLDRTDGPCSVRTDGIVCGAPPDHDWHQPTRLTTTGPGDDDGHVCPSDQPTGTVVIVTCDTCGRTRRAVMISRDEQSNRWRARTADEKDDQ